MSLRIRFWNPFPRKKKIPLGPINRAVVNWYDYRVHDIPTTAEFCTYRWTETIPVEM